MKKRHVLNIYVSISVQFLILQVCQLLAEDHGPSTSLPVSRSFKVPKYKSSFDVHSFIQKLMYTNEN